MVLMSFLVDGELVQAREEVDVVADQSVIRGSLLSSTVGIVRLCGVRCLR